LLTTNSGVLSVAGQAYVQMPVHSTNLYYRIPGRLQAERYVTATQMNIVPTTDTNGLADMTSTASGASLNYQLQVDTPGKYPLNFRITGPLSPISVYENGVLLATASPVSTGWSGVSTTVSLPAGEQTLRVVLGAASQELNWIDFLATNGTPSVPDNLTAAGTNGQVALNWSISSGATGYVVRQSTINGGPYTNIANVASTTYTNTGLVNGTTYYYVVSATNAAGSSSNSLPIAAALAAPLANLALNQPVTVSSVENSGYPGSNAVDGNTATRWSSAFSDPQWIYVDLGATYNVSEVILDWENAYGKSYQIQVSNDATNWTAIYSTVNGAGGIEDLTGLSGVGRYVRMYGTVRSGIYGYSLWEFEVFGTPANTPPALAPVAPQTILAGRTLLVTNSASDTDVPAPMLTFSLPQSPAGATIGPGSGIVAWRPTIAQSPSTQTVAVVVTDNGTPPLSATQTFNVAVIRPTNPVVGNATVTNGLLGFWINGNSGPDYTVLVSSNLTSWAPIATNTPASLPYFWSVTNSTFGPANFYRILLGP
jgi:hypothetical protein